MEHLAKWAAPSPVGDPRRAIRIRDGPVNGALRSDTIRQSRPGGHVSAAVAPRARRASSLDPTGRFRVNANGKTIDIWLLRCAVKRRQPVG